MAIGNVIDELKYSLRSAGYNPDSMGGELDNLAKAIETTSTDTATAYTGGRAIQAEYLDSTMKSNLYESEEFTFTKKMYETGLKINIRTTEYKSLRRETYGGLGGTMDENDISRTTNSDYLRLSELVKTFSTKRGVTLHAKMAESVVDPENEEYTSGTYVVNARREVCMWYGDESIIASEFNGMASKVNRADTPNNFFDLRGQKIDSADGEKFLTKDAPKAIRLGRNEYGEPIVGLATDIWTTPGIRADIHDITKDRERYGVAEASTNATLNPYIFNTIRSVHGYMNINENIWMNFYESPFTDTTGLAAPAVTPTSPADGTGRTLFNASAAGNYYYVIQAINKHGRGLQTTTAAVTVAASDKVVLTITNVPDAEGYIIYRSKKDASDGTDCRFIGRVAKTAGATTVFTDWNEKLPGTHKIYLMSMTPSQRAIQYASFFDLLKFQLYSTNEATYPFLLLTAGTLVVDTPLKHAVIDNISPSDLGWY